MLWLGVLLAQLFFNLALSVPPNRPVAFIASFSLATGLAGFIGGLLSAPLLTFFQTLAFSIGNIHWTGYHWLFVLTGIARASAWIVLRPVKEDNAWRTRDVLQEVKIEWRRLRLPWKR